MIRRTTSVLLIVLLFCLVTLGVPLLRSIETNESERLARSLDQDAWTLASALGPAAEARDRVGLRRIVSGAVEDGDLAIVVATSSERLLEIRTRAQPSDALRLNLERGLFRALAYRSATPAFHPRGLDQQLAVVPIAHNGRVVAALAVSYVDRYWLVRKERRRNGLLIVGLTGLGLSLGFSLALSRWIAQPVRKLQRSARSFARGDFLKETATQSGGPHEVRALGETLQAMASQLDTTMARHRSFLANASHQLRTPLTAIALRLENLKYRIGEDLDRDQYDLGLMQTAIHELSSQLDELVQLAKLDHQSGDKRLPIRAFTLFNERIAFWGDEAVQRGVTLSATEIGSDVMVFATPARLAQALDNLITNAIDASPRGSRIELVSAVPRTRVTNERVAKRVGQRHRRVTPSIHAERANTAVAELRIIDHGTGIQPDRMEDAFRLYSTDKLSDRSQLGGSGLGLSLVQLLVLSDRGVVSLEATPGGGTTAVVTLPQALSHADHGR